jgi:hypothetical protein
VEETEGKAGQALVRGMGVGCGGDGRGAGGGSSARLVREEEEEEKGNAAERRIRPATMAADKDACEWYEDGCRRSQHAARRDARPVGPASLTGLTGAQNFWGCDNSPPLKKSRPEI